MKFEIFKTGTHTSDKGVTKDYSLEDLNFIADSYNPDEDEAPIVIGHPVDNSPAFGWISSLDVTADGKLVADAPDDKLQPDFLNLLKQGTYKKRSISLTPEGKLRHVGFLGGAVPAVKGLADIQFYQPSSNIFEFDLEQVKQKEELNELSQKVDELKTSLDNLSLNYSETNSTKERLNEVLSQVNSLRNKITQNELSDYLDDKVTAGNLTPAIKEKLLSFSSFITSQNFSSDFSETKFQGDINNLLKDLSDSFPKIIHFENFAEKPDAVDEIKDEDYGDFSVDEQSKSLHKKALSIMKKDNISYIGAVKKIMEKV
ncbi:MAG TPA: hypothetical protein VGA29_09045 [Ignavibacteriaceae bacterium]